MTRRVVLSLVAFAVLSAFADATYYSIYDDSSGSVTYTYSFSGSAADLYSIFFPDSSPSYVSPTLVDFPDGSFVGSIDDGDFDPLCYDGYIPSDPAYADFPFAPAVDPLSGGGSSGGSDDGGEGEGGGGSSASGGGGGGSGGGSSGGGSGGGGGGSSGSGGGGGGGSPDDGEGGGEGDPAVSGGGAGWDAFNPDDPLKSAEEGMSMISVAVYSLLGVCAALVLLFLYYKLTKKSLNKVSASGGGGSSRPYGRAYVSKSGRVYFYGRRK